MGDGGQLDLFTVTAIDPPWRDNRDAMEFPFLSLQKRRTVPIEFGHDGISIEVYPHPKLGIATIWDWDVMIFAASHINEAIENRRQISPRITFVPHDLLKQIGRGTGSLNYQRLADAIRRLAMTSVITNIREVDQPDVGRERGFHWLTDYSLPKRYGRRVYTTPDDITHITPRDPDGEPDPVRQWEIELPPWIYNAIVRRGDILAVHPDYFQLTGGLERWLYRLARKAVPDRAEPPAIRFKMETLHARSGVTRDLRVFAFDIRQIAETQPLPEYGVQIEHRKGQRELVTLYRDKAKPCRPPRGRRLKTIRGEHVEPAVNTDAYLEEMAPLVIEANGPPPIGRTTVEQIREARMGGGVPPAPEDIPALRKEAAQNLELARRIAAATEARCLDNGEAWDEVRQRVRDARDAIGDLLNRLHRVDVPTPAESQPAKLIEQPAEAASVHERARALLVQTIEKLIEGVDGERAACVLPGGTHCLVAEPIPGAVPPADLKTALREAMEEVLRSAP
jgi:plasmid replication initiation protein